MVENTRVLLCVADVCEIKVWFKDLTAVAVNSEVYLKESYPTNVHCARRYDRRHFQGPRKYGIYQYLREIRFHRLITGQNRLVFYKNNIWDHPTCFFAWIF